MVTTNRSFKEYTCQPSTLLVHLSPGHDPSAAALIIHSAMSFSLTKELALSSDIVLTCWCPTMDLCAVVSADGQLHLHRMDWQQLWALSPEVCVCSTA
jgi:hypothetical protein